ITVLACEQYEAGTTVTEPMAFMGATIIMVEPPDRGQIGRVNGIPPRQGVDLFYHIGLTLSKKSITLNLKHPKGIEIFKEMTKKVDIVHDNLGPGTMDRLGFGYEALKQVNPRIIVSTVKGFGKGPYEKYFCMDTVAQAVGGSLSLTGYPDKPPINPGTSTGDTGSGMFCLGAVLAAIHQRDVTGEGQFVEVGMSECSLNYNRANWALRQAEKDPMFQGPPLERVGNTLPGVAPQNIYKAKDSEKTDNYVMISIREEKEWKALLIAIGRADLIGNPKFKDPNTRWQNVAEVDKIIEDWTSKLNPYEAFHILAQAGVPAGVTQNCVQMVNDPHFSQSGIIQEFDHPHRGPYKQFGCVQRLSDSEPIYFNAPLLGQHNSEIYGRYLGYTHYDLNKLKTEGVI
ncbi:MAG: CoA transferase, partial [Chloroflexota bacterium]